MSRPQFVAAAALMALALVLSTLTGVFSARLAVTAAEGSDLRGRESIWVQATVTELEEAAADFAPGTRALREVQPGTRAVAPIRGSWSDLPLHAGRAPAGQGEAVAGARRGQVGDVIDAGGRSATVVGSLGLRPESRLADDAVVEDRTLFPASPSRLRLDGPDVDTHYRTAFPGRLTERVRGGTNSRTNVDSVSPVLIALSIGVAGIVSMAAATFVGRCEARRNQLLWAVGHGRPALRGLSALRFTGVLVVAAVPACGIGTLVAAANHVLVVPWHWLLPCVALSAGTAAVSAWRRSWN